MAKRVLAVLAVVVLTGGAVGAWVWHNNKPEVQLARLQRQAADAMAAKDKAAMKVVLKDVDSFVERFAEEEDLTRQARLTALDLVRRGLDDKDSLLKRLEGFRKHHPKDALADKMLLEEADLWWQHKKKPLRALRRLEARLKQEPLPEDGTLGELLFRMGQINDAVGEFDAAAEAYQELVDDLPKHPRADEALYRLAEIYATRLDREEEAREAYEKLAEKSPDTELGREARERAGELKEYEEMGGGGTPTEQRQLTTIIRQSGDEALKELLREPKKLVSVHTQVTLTKLVMQVSGSVVFEATGDLSESTGFLYNHNFRVRSLSMNGEPVKPAGEGMSLEVTLRKPMKKGDRAVLQWESRLSLKAQDGPLGKLMKLTAVPVGGMGFVSPDEGYLTATDFWYPTLDYDGLFWMTTEVDFPARHTALAAGELERERRGGGRYRATWTMPVRHGHNSLCYGQFEKLENGPYSIYISGGDRDAAPALMEETEKAMAFYAERFGPSKYPVLKICQIESPIFKGYAEATLVMLGGREARRSPDSGVLAHELAHQWWGNQVPISLEADTQPWLWEGFASYAEVLFQEHKDGRAEARRKLDIMATRFFHDKLRHGDVAITENTIQHPGYLGVVYQKGAWVLHMLRGQLGEEAFQKAMRDYAIRRTDKAVTVPVFRSELNRSTGGQWDTFLEQWIDRPGYLQLDPATVSQDPDGTLTTALVQGQPVYDLTVEVAASGKERERRLRLPLSGEETPVVMDVPFDARRFTVDPDGWLLLEPLGRQPVPVNPPVP